jgi:DNA-binding NarL/FixJ family response regulator
MSSVTILLVDDYKPWRHYVFLRLKKEPELQIIYEACDGLEAVERSQKLQPDLILLDIGLPKMNGIEVVRQVRNLAPRSKILIVSQTSFPDVAQEALTLGASGYIDKADAAIELLPAVNAVLRGQKFVGRRLAGHNFAGTSDVGDPSVS